MDSTHRRHDSQKRASKHSRQAYSSGYKITGPQQARTSKRAQGHNQATKLLGAAALAVMAGFLILAVTGLPEFGSFQNRHVTMFFLEHGLQKTGSANIVNAIIWDFRGYDTLGEETILFCAALSVFMIIRRKKYGRHD